jgi:hypothetical protein
MPPRLYKFIERRYGEDLLNRGALRITTLYRCRQIETANGRDMYVYCTTSFPRRELQKRWRSDDGDDVWIEIFDPPGFFHVLAQATRHLGQFLGVHQVCYGPRISVRGIAPEVSARWQNVPAAILKPPSFRIEREWRALWQPVALPIDPADVVAPELPKFCRLHRAVKSPPIAA